MDAAMHRIKIFGWKSTFQMLVFSALSAGAGVAAATAVCCPDRGFDISLLSPSASSLMAVRFGSVIVVMANAATIIPIMPLI